MTADIVPDSIVVLSVTNALEAVVTTDGDHGFLDGQIIRLYVPPEYQMIVNKMGEVTVLTSSSFSVNIDTVDLKVFNIPTFTSGTQTAFTNAQAIPVSGIWRNIA